MENKKFECGECGKLFSRKSLLEIHTLIHINEKENWYECEVCGKKLQYQAGLHIHMTIHNLSNIKYSCLQCGKSFATERYLQQHNVIHTGVKKFSCSQCEKKFYRQKDLNVHTTRVHQSKCGECGKSFKLKYHSCHKPELLPPTSSKMSSQLLMENLQHKSAPIITTDPAPASQIPIANTGVATNKTPVENSCTTTPVVTAPTICTSQVPVAVPSCGAIPMITSAAPTLSTNQIPIVVPSAGAIPMITGAAPTLSTGQIPIVVPSAGAIPMITSAAPTLSTGQIPIVVPNCGAIPITPSAAPIFYTGQIPIVAPNAIPMINQSNISVMPMLYAAVPVKIISSKQYEQFPCPKCGRNFQYKYLLKRHEKTHDADTSTKHLHECGRCERLFTTKVALDAHHVKVHENKFQFTTQVPRWIAPKVDLSYQTFRVRLITPTSTNNQQQISISDTPLMKCFICGEVPACKSSLVDRFRSQLTKMRYLCPQCDGTLECSANLKEYFKNTSLLMRY